MSNIQIKKSINDCLESSSIHAIPNIVRNDKLTIKLIWIISFIISSSFCAWFILESINEYFKYDVVTKIDVKHMNELAFPVVSICNLNPFTTNESINLFNYKNTYNLEKDDLLINIRDNKTHRHLFGRQINDLIIKCEFVNSKNECDLNEYFEQYFDLNYGNCYRFNSGKNMIGKKAKQKHVQNTGIYNSLNLLVYIGSTDTNTDIFSIENGLNIFISNESSNSFYGEGINISPGTSTKIIIDKYSIIKQPMPYSECTKDLNTIDSYNSDCYRKLFESNVITKYVFNDCFRMCFQKLLAYNCECQTSFYEYYYNKTLRRCSNKDEKDSSCLLKQWIYLSTDSNVLKNCDCPYTCEKYDFYYSISQAEFPTRFYYYSLKLNELKYKNLSYDEVRQSMAKIQIFYNELKETIISQEIKIQLVDLVSNIGGIMGLFLGMSFLSFVEFVEIILKVLNNSFEIRKIMRRIDRS